MRDGLTPEEQGASELLIKELGKGTSKEAIVETLVKGGWFRIISPICGFPRLLLRDQMFIR